MYFLILIATLAFFVWVASEFGRSLSSRHAPLWYAAGALIVLAEVRSPWIYRLASWLGVVLPSNLVFAGMILFLCFLLIDQTRDLTRVMRGNRSLVSHLAVERYRTTRGGGGPAPRSLVVLPCFNEARSLPDLIGKLDALVAGSAGEIDYCLVNDGSTDDSAKILERLAPGRHATHRLNIGVSGALLTGFEIALARGAEYAVQCDSDGQHPIAEIPVLLDRARRAGADLLIGSRFAASPEEQGGDASTTLSRRLGGRLISLALGLFRCGWVTDPTSGLRVYSSRAMRTLLEEMPDEYPEPESIALLHARGLRIAEHRVRMQRREHGKSSLTALKSVRYMTKVGSALLGLRMRTLWKGTG